MDVGSEVREGRMGWGLGVNGRVNVVEWLVMGWKGEWDAVTRPPCC